LAGGAPCFSLLSFAKSPEHLNYFSHSYSFQESGNVNQVFIHDQDFASVFHVVWRLLFFRFWRRFVTSFDVEFSVGFVIFVTGLVNSLLPLSIGDICDWKNMIISCHTSFTLIWFVEPSSSFIN
jgi:hypothetical protein